MPGNFLTLAFEITADPEQAAKALESVKAMGLNSTAQLQAALAKIAESQEGAIKSVDSIIFATDEQIKKLMEELLKLGIQLKIIKKDGKDAADAMRAALQETQLESIPKAKALQQLEQGRQKNIETTKASLLRLAQIEQEENLKAIQYARQEKERFLQRFEESRLLVEQKSREATAALAAAEAEERAGIDRKIQTQNFRQDLRALEGRFHSLGLTTGATVSRMARFTGAMRGLTFPINRVAGRIVEITNSMLRLSPLMGVQIPTATLKATKSTEELSAAYQNVKKQIELFSAGRVSATAVEESMTAVNDTLAASNISLAASLGPIAIAAGVVSAAYTALGVISGEIAAKYVAEIGDMSRATGLASETVSGLYVAAKTAGLPFKSLQTEITYFTRQLGESGLQTKRFKETLAVLGITSHDTGTALSQAVDKLNTYKDSNRVAALASNLFSRSTSGQAIEMVKLVHVLGAYGGVQKAVDFAAKMHLDVTKQEIEKAQALQFEQRALFLQLHGLVIELGEHFLPKVIHWIALMENVGPVINDVLIPLKLLWDGFKALTDIIALSISPIIDFAAAMNDVAHGRFKQAEHDFDNIKAAGKNLVGDFKSAIDNLKSIDTDPFRHMREGAKKAEEEALRMGKAFTALQGGGNAPGSSGGGDHLKIFNDLMAEQLKRLQDVTNEMVESSLPAYQRVEHSYDTQRQKLEALLATYVKQAQTGKITAAQMEQIWHEEMDAENVLAWQHVMELEKVNKTIADQQAKAMQKLAEKRKELADSEAAWFTKFGGTTIKDIGSKTAEEISKTLQKATIHTASGHSNQMESLQAALITHGKFEGINLNPLDQSFATFNANLEKAYRTASQKTIPTVTKMQFEMMRLGEIMDAANAPFERVAHSLEKISIQFASNNEHLSEAGRRSLEAASKNAQLAQSLMKMADASNASGKAQKKQTQDQIAGLASIAAATLLHGKALALFEGAYNAAMAVKAAAEGHWWAAAEYALASALFFKAANQAGKASGQVTYGSGAGASSRASSASGVNTQQQGAYGPNNALAQGSRAPQYPQGGLTVAIMGNEEAGNWLATTLNKAVEQNGTRLVSSHTQSSPPIGQ